VSTTDVIPVTTAPAGALDVPVLDLTSFRAVASRVKVVEFETVAVGGGVCAVARMPGDTIAARIARETARVEFRRAERAVIRGRCRVGIEQSSRFGRARIHLLSRNP